MVHSSARSPLEVGSLIADTYTVEKIIGKGGMGAVFLASHARLPGKKVAIKVLHTDVADSDSLARFRREAEIASRLGHPNIVEVHDFNVLPDGTPYLVLEFLAGESLAHRLARGPLSVEATMTILRQIGSALAAAHREDIIHRDLKPANVFLVPTEVDGVPSERAKVLDFGISKIRGSTTVQTQDTSILGTPQYMAPEQALGNHAAVDARTDVFALGAMTYEMLCGKPAFGGASVPEVVFKVVYEEPLSIAERVPLLPAHVAAAVHKALAKKADERFPDVAAFVEALTGQPLLSGKRPLSIAPADGTGSGATTGGNVLGPDSNKVSSQQALDQTIGSGDHGKQAGIAMAETMASGDHAKAAVGIAETMASGEHPGGKTTLSSAAGVAETVAAPVPPPGKGKLVIAVVAILALAAVAIAFLMTRKSDDAKPEQPIAMVTVDAAPPVPVAAVDAAPAVVVDAAPVAAAIDAAPVKKPPDKPDKPDKPPVEPDPPDEPAEDDAGTAECIKLLATDTDDAMKCANAVLAKKPNNPGALMVKGIAYCADNDTEKALGIMRRLSGKPRWRKKLIAGCDDGYDIKLR